MYRGTFHGRDIWIAFLRGIIWTLNWFLKKVIKGNTHVTDTLPVSFPYTGKLCVNLGCFTSIPSVIPTTSNSFHYFRVRPTGGVIALDTYSWNDFTSNSDRSSENDQSMNEKSEENCVNPVYSEQDNPYDVDQPSATAYKAIHCHK